LDIVLCLLSVRLKKILVGMSSKLARHTASVDSFGNQVSTKQIGLAAGIAKWVRG
jgi:hypothetical protein